MHQFLPISTIEAILKCIFGITPGLIIAYVIVKALSFYDDNPMPIKKRVVTLGFVFLLTGAALLFFPQFVPTLQKVKVRLS